MLPRHHLSYNWSWNGLNFVLGCTYIVHCRSGAFPQRFYLDNFLSSPSSFHYTISNFGESTVLLSIGFSCLLSRPPGSDRTNRIVINKAWIYVTHKLIHRWTLKILQRVYMVTYGGVYVCFRHRWLMIMLRFSDPYQIWQEYSCQVIFCVYVCAAPFSKVCLFSSLFKNNWLQMKHVNEKIPIYIFCSEQILRIQGEEMGGCCIDA